MGGISSVIKGHLSSALTQSFNFIIIPSHIDGSKIKKLAVALRGLLKTIAALSTQRIDVVHFHSGDFPSPLRKFFYFLIVKAFNKKVIFHVHGALFITQFHKSLSLFKSLVVFLLQHSDVVICLSKSWEANIKSIAPLAKTVIIPNAIPIPTLQPPTKAMGPFTVAFLGRIGYRKGIFLLLETIAKLRDQGISIYLEIGGNGKTSRMFESIHTLRLQDQIRYHGWIGPGRKDQLLRRVDAFVLPSYGEGMPMALLEAMAYGLPVVTTCVGGIPELVIDKHNGLLIEPGNRLALENSLKHLYAHPQSCNQLGKNARMTVLKNHDLDTMTERLHKTYENLMRLPPNQQHLTTI